MDKNYDHLIKVLLLGDSGVGKSSLMTRYVEEAFTGDEITTIGIDFKIKTVTIEDKVVKIQIWDTAGQENFRTVTSAYYRGVHGAMVHYSIDDESTFYSIQMWLTEVDRYSDPNVSKMLVGTKSDVQERAVDYDTAKAAADEKGIAFVETSAKENINVDKAFMTLVTEILENPSSFYNTRNQKNIPTNGQHKQASGFCSLL